MKNLLVVSLAVFVLLGAGCTEASKKSSNITSIPSSNTVIDNNQFSLSLPSGIIYEEEQYSGRYQNFISQDGPQTLGENEYFVEFSTTGSGDLEFYDQSENVSTVIIDEQKISRGERKDSYKGGDTTKYVTVYFRSGNGDQWEPVFFYIYADTQSGLEKGEATLQKITWKNGQSAL